MFVKSLKIIVLLVVSVLLVGVFVQIVDFSITPPKKAVSPNARQSDGAFIDYYNNGKIASEEFYKDGLRYGEWRFYYEDGALKQELSYQKGNLDGEQRYFSSDGALIYSEIYQNGTPISQEIANDSLYNYTVNLSSHGKLVFDRACKSCHINKKEKVVHPYYLQKLSGDSLTIDSVFIKYLNQVHDDSLRIPDYQDLDSVVIYDVRSVIHYIDLQYQTAKRRPKDAVRLRKVRIIRKTPQI